MLAFLEEDLREIPRDHPRRWYTRAYLNAYQVGRDGYAASTASVTTRHPHPPKRAAPYPAELDPCEPESGSITSVSSDGVAEGSGCAVNGGGDGDGGGGDFLTTLPAWQGPTGYHAQGSNIPFGESLTLMNNPA